MKVLVEQEIVSLQQLLRELDLEYDYDPIDTVYSELYENPPSNLNDRKLATRNTNSAFELKCREARSLESDIYG